MADVERTRIKICGVRDPDTALAAVRAGTDAIGLVFVPDSPRGITVDQARVILRSLPAFVEPVGLFVDACVEHIRQTADDIGLRTVQLHGSETPAHVTQLMPLRVIKAIAFQPHDAADRLKPWMSVCEELAGLLWDVPAGPGHDAPPRGGSGQTFDWSALANLKEAGDLDALTPLILAGGLAPDNVGEAITTVHPYAVDVSSGVESAPGVKNHDLIHAFCRAVRRADGT